MSGRSGGYPDDDLMKLKTKNIKLTDHIAASRIFPGKMFLWSEVDKHLDVQSFAQWVGVFWQSALKGIMSIVHSLIMLNSWL